MSATSQGADPRAGVGFLIPWSYDWGGGVTNAVLGLATQCSGDPRYRPIALEYDWGSRSYSEDQWRGFTRVRLRLRAPWAESGTFKIALSYLAYLPGDLYRLRNLIKRHRLVVINRQFPGLDSFNFVLLRRLGLYSGKNIFTFQGSDVRDVLRTRGLTRRLWRHMLRGADRLVFVSEGLKEEFLAFDPAVVGRAVVVHNGVDPESFLRHVDRPLPAQALFDGSHRVVISVGGFEYRKGYDLLVQAFESVLQERRDVRLAIVGRSGAGPTLNAIRQLIADRGLEAHVTLITDVPHDEVAALVRRADVFVLSSRWRKGEFGEGLPLVLAEAGALAKPIVSSRSTGCDEIIVDGETGRLVELENVPQLAQAILDQLNDPENAQRMGRNLQKRVAERFTWKEAWRKYRSLFEES